MKSIKNGFFFMLGLVIISAVLLLTACGNDAFAQTSTSSANSTATSTATAGNTTVNLSPVIPSAGNGGSSGTASLKGSRAPDIFIGAAPASAPCRIAIGAGVSLVVGSIGGNGSTNDTECQARENARVLSVIGENEMALAVLCNQQEIASANPNRCKDVLAKAGVSIAGSKNKTGSLNVKDSSGKWVKSAQ